MISINVSDLKEDIAEALDRMVYTGERVLLQRQDKEVAALITLEELELLEKIEVIENETDLNDAIKVLKRIKSSKNKKLIEDFYSIRNNAAFDFWNSPEEDIY